MTDMQIEFILEILLRSSAIAGVGISLYVWQTKSRIRENKRDMAHILRNEVKRVLNIIPSRERERTISNRSDRIPNSKVYSGLLQTGNIRFFNDGLQDKLDEWYSFIDDFSFEKIDSDVGISLVQDLECMELQNKPYRKILERS